MGDFTEIGNRLEAGLWILIALGLASRSFFVAKAVRAHHWILAIAFLLFGISDLVEAQSGAWWRPPWLLVWKGSCLVVIAGGFWLLWKAGKRTQD